jgi:ribosomal protein L28
MAKECAICSKKSRMVGKRKKLMSRYNPLPKKRKYPNLQWVHIPIGMKKESYRKLTGKRVLACTKCIKAMGKLN